MLLIEIKNKKGKVLDHGNFSSQEEGLNWFSTFIKNGRYGKDAYTYKKEKTPAIPAVYEDRHYLIKDAVLDNEGNVITPAEYETKRVLVQEAIDATYEDVEVPAEYEIVITDISSEIKAKKDKEDLLKETYAKMAEAFGTTNTDTATANYNTYKLMKEDPSLFIGELFASEEEVIFYANSKLAPIIEYAKWRVKRIDEYERAKKVK